MPNQCDCVATTTCEDQGADCGEIFDGCLMVTCGNANRPILVAVVESKTIAEHLRHRSCAAPVRQLADSVRATKSAAVATAKMASAPTASELAESTEIFVPMATVRAAATARAVVDAACVRVRAAPAAPTTRAAQVRCALRAAAAARPVRPAISTVTAAVAIAKAGNVVKVPLVPHAAMQVTASTAVMTTASACARMTTSATPMTIAAQDMRAFPMTMLLPS